MVSAVTETEGFGEGESLGSSSSPSQVLGPLLELFTTFDGLLGVLLTVVEEDTSSESLSSPTVENRQTEFDGAWVSQQVAELSAQFQKILSTIASTNLTPQTEQQIRPYQTEAHRRLRLLSIEAMRLRTAKQPQTIEKGRSQLSAHLTQIQQFVQAMIAALSDA